MTSDNPFAPLWESIVGFGVILAVGWIIRQLKARADKRLQNGAKNWPYAYGTVEHAGAKMIGGGKTAHGLASWRIPMQSMATIIPVFITFRQRARIKPGIWFADGKSGGS